MIEIIKRMNLKNSYLEYICVIWIMYIAYKIVTSDNCEHQDKTPKSIGKSRQVKAENDPTINREQLYEDRRNVITRGCEMLKHSINISTENIIVDKLHDISYCHIPKVGSTFWSRTLTVLSNSDKVNSPFDITYRDVITGKWNDMLQESDQVVTADKESFMIHRDPWARLFSGYENKVYHPDAKFWRLVGRDVVYTMRQQNGQKPPYGYDITFPEFVKYIIYKYEHNEKINEHFVPMHQHCNPCKSYYRHIGHFETFADDAKYILSKWRQKFPDIKLQFQDFVSETTRDTVKDVVRHLFAAKQMLPYIDVPFSNLMLRSWRDLQIRGYISKEIEFPFHGDVDDITAGHMIDKILTAVASSKDKTDVKLQRNEALVQAYRQVPLQDMEKLRKFLLTDCILFGYDDRPALLFDRTTPINQTFVYLDGLPNSSLYKK